MPLQQLLQHSLHWLPLAWGQRLEAVSQALGYDEGQANNR